MVSEHPIVPPDEPDLLYCRYIICRNIDILGEIQASDFTRIPVENPLLVRNECLGYLASLLDEERSTKTTSRFHGGSFRNREEYQRAHPDAVLTDHERGRFSFYELLRVPSRRELLDMWAPGRPLIKRLLDEGAEPADVSIIASFFQACGEDHYQEDLITRPLWGAFLAVTNVSDSPLTPTQLVARASTTHRGFRPFRPPEDPVGEFDLPAAPIQQGATVIVPLGAVLGPVGTVEEETWSRTDQDIERRGPVQVLTHSGAQNAEISHAAVGPFLWPQGIQVTRSGLNAYQGVHELDLTNVYTLDRYWEVGSCPHLFFVFAGRRLIYGGTLLAAGHCETTLSTFIVPSGADMAIIAELEDEVTHIDRIAMSGTQHRLRLTLTRDQLFAFPVTGGMLIGVEGWYKPTNSSRRVGRDAGRRAALVDEFIRRNRAMKL